MTRISFPPFSKNLWIWLVITVINIILTLIFDIDVNSSSSVLTAFVLWIVGIILSENLQERVVFGSNLTVTILIVINEVYFVFAGTMKIFGMI